MTARRNVLNNDALDGVGATVIEAYLDWWTTRKYVGQEDFSPSMSSPEKEEHQESKLNTFNPLIDG